MFFEFSRPLLYIHSTFDFGTSFKRIRVATEIEIGSEFRVDTKKFIKIFEKRYFLNVTNNFFDNFLKLKKKNNNNNFLHTMEKS